MLIPEIVMSQNALTLVVGWPNEQFQNTNTSVQTGTMIRKTEVNVHWTSRISPPRFLVECRKK